MSKQAEEIIEGLIGIGCREYNNDGKDYCKFCNGEEYGWIEKEGRRQDFDHRLVHNYNCVYMRAMAYLGISDAEAYHDE
jgi:hypothetical protein